MALPDYTTQDPATYKANIDSSVDNSVEKTGDTMTGDLTLGGQASPNLTLQPSIDGFPTYQINDVAGNTRFLIRHGTVTELNQIFTRSATGTSLTILEFTDDGNVNVNGSAPVNDGDLTRKDYVDGKMVILDTPELLHSGAGDTLSSWLSSSRFSSTTLSAANAVKAIIRLTSELNLTATKVTSQIYIRKAGTSISPNSTTVLGFAEKETNTSINMDVNATGESIVNLDTNSDFEYYLFGIASSTISVVKVTLVGYYV